MVVMQFICSENTNEQIFASCECQVLLETLNLAPRSAAGIHWAEAHWREAKIFALTVRGWDNLELMQLSKMLADGCWTSHQSKSTSMQQVKHIALHLEAGSTYHGYFGLWTIISSSHTPRLESLCIACDSFVWFKEFPIPTLKHLRVEVKNEGLLHMMHHQFQVFTQLETLTICCDINEKKLGDWDLNVAELKRLQCVSLQMVWPHTMSVPVGCQVHFVCHSISDASKVWNKGLGTACTSCHLMELVSFEQVAGQPSLHHCLQTIVELACPNLTILKLTCSAVGSQENSLKIGKSLSALRELDIRAVQDLYMWIGASLPLESLTLCSKGKLQCAWEDMILLLSGLRRFRYACDWPCMANLLAWYLREFMGWTSVARADGLTDMHKAGASEYSDVALESSVCKDRTCETCIDCLRRKHLPVSDNADWPFIGLFAQP